MAEPYNEMMNLPINMRPSLEQAMARMIEAEKCHRSNALTAKLLNASHLRYTAHMEDIECSTARNLTRAMLDEVADCRFIRNGENLLITGLTGCGKSYLACAIGWQACMLGLRTEYMNMNHFVDTIAQSRMDGTFQKLLKRLDRNDLIKFLKIVVTKTDRHELLFTSVCFCHSHLLLFINRIIFIMFI